MEELNCRDRNHNFSPIGKTLLSLTAFALISCTVGVPEVETLRKMSGFSLDQTSFSVGSKTKPVFALSGKCNSNYQSVEVSLDGGKNWLSLTSLANPVSFDCATGGTFSGQISASASSLDVSKWTRAGAYNEVLVRGVSDLGYSEDFRLELLAATNGIGSFTAAGSNTPLTGGNFKLTGSVTAFNSSPSMTGGNYRLQGEVLW